ncbi:tRNA pseudouridine synthase A [Caldalkalibacillus thermarum TA2.A1]|uniref:tRNA pseudouridine synthase A n=1 Tax=Caldalkalibacillus thermarum (strain TA2.A1) TaxID=986075 RepID=F5L9J5_CALTT|nr:tRNA pseudouridine(38-40) synthase TruA [Caldalkalibacillus thermarum]EGL81982.1 tRNA pseudouridine synthase A [Caldalkalibacillus thermarum TA2.A1]QZT34452.1 tRNA pseudouridine(38-40) synthase TruA [Caldalkalibacillus thermarum TA2.A1]
MSEQTTGVHKWKCTVAYDGTAYAGFQRQPNAVTIQGELEAVLKRMHRHPVQVVGSGRTDAGVHARGQVIHFESSLALEENEWTKALNAQLPGDIRILRTEKVPASFHARYDVRGKEYRYFICNAPVHDPFVRQYSYHVPLPLDVTLMQEAGRLFEGTHDFTAFSSAKTEVADKVRTIDKLTLEVLPVGRGTQAEQAKPGFDREVVWPGWAHCPTAGGKPRAGQMITVICRGTGFLYHMVRIIVGTLIEVGKGKKSPADVERALKVKDRNLAGPTAPPEGLFLWRVFY